jgi:hypothetical protein
MITNQRDISIHLTRSQGVVTEWRFSRGDVREFGRVVYRGVLIEERLREYPDPEAVYA